MLIAPLNLVNGAAVVQVTHVDPIEYIHLELAEHAVIFAEDAPWESFVDDDSRVMFHNASEYFRFYPNEVSTVARFGSPRVEEGVALEMVREQLTMRARFLQHCSRAA